MCAWYDSFGMDPGACPTLVRPGKFVLPRTGGTRTNANQSYATTLQLLPHQLAPPHPQRKRADASVHQRHRLQRLWLPSCKSRASSSARAVHMHLPCQDHTVLISGRGAGCYRSCGLQRSARTCQSDRPIVGQGDRHRVAPRSRTGVLGPIRTVSHRPSYDAAAWSSPSVQLAAIYAAQEPPAARRPILRLACGYDRICHTCRRR